MIFVEIVCDKCGKSEKKYYRPVFREVRYTMPVRWENGELFKVYCSDCTEYAGDYAIYKDFESIQDFQYDMEILIKKINLYLNRIYKDKQSKTTDTNDEL